MRPLRPLIVIALLAFTTAAEAERASSESVIQVAVVKDRCGANVLEKPPGDVSVKGKVLGKGRLRLDVAAYVYYCDPGPRFVATATEGVIRVIPAPRPPNTPRSNCACAHHLRLRLSGIDSGEWQIRVDTGETEPKLGPDGWVNEKVEAVTRVKVP